MQQGAAMNTLTAHANADPDPSALKSEKRRAYAATLVAALYVLCAIGAPLMVRYGPDTEPSLVMVTASAPAQHAAAPRCATAPEFGRPCGAADTFPD
jgi:hypothetical protein